MELLEELERLKEPDFISPLGVWIDFEKGHVWRDMRRELYVWLSDTWRNLEVETDQDKISELRGRARTIRELLDLPANILIMLEEREEDYVE